jgi:hypothetical protein
VGERAAKLAAWREEVKRAIADKRREYNQLEVIEDNKA